MTVTEYILNYDPGIPTIWIVGTYIVVGCVIVALFIHGGNKVEFIRNCSLSLLAGYVFLVLCSTIMCREARFNASCNFHPFLHIHSKNVIIIGERYLNIVLFVPIGLLAAVSVNKRRFVKVMFISVGLSVFIEVIQFMFRRGVCNIDDVIHNTAGCVIGYILFQLICISILHKLQ